MSSIETITQLRDKHVDDFNASNVDGMAEQICEDTITMPPHLPPISGKEATVEWIRQGMSIASTHMELTSQDLVVMGDYAYDQFGWTQEITLKENNETTSDSGNCVWVWRHEEDGSWKVWRAIWNSEREQTNVWTGVDR